MSALLFFIVAGCAFAAGYTACLAVTKSSRHYVATLERQFNEAMGQCDEWSAAYEELRRAYEEKGK